MTQFRINILGEYNDWCEIYKDNILIHNGSLIGILSKVENKIFLRINYGTPDYFYSEIKYLGNNIISVPRQPNLLNSQYRYQPLIFNTQEFEAFIDTVYFDKELLKELSEVSKEDLINMWLLSNPNRGNYSDILELEQSTLKNILFFSDDCFDVSNLKKVIDSSSTVISQICGNLEPVIIYMDSDKGMYEWSGLVKIEDKILLRLDDYYFINS
ncbi:MULTISPECIES: hypothetical protein [unclassified Enterococcus]|uniref:hypothetical protein n=1 Tax=unclassified Enterococcus TaxID=2608891 RepID=UPI001CE05100|nr:MULTISPECIES: hypothetical protein [unclassified Enterococcus]MCA5013051.1 hypothetical protein [Enterococcus sp. S23]MCA5016301.1 hypothetical protein [Enterococcus sp. S22(2020)]